MSNPIIAEAWVVAAAYAAVETTTIDRGRVVRRTCTVARAT